MEPYTLDPERVSLTRLMDLVLTRKLIPSRMPLKEDAPGRFCLLEKAGISNMGQLIKSLGNKQKTSAMAERTGIPENYLVLLKREAGSFLAKPFPLEDFPGIPFEYSEVLRSKGIRNTRDFFHSAQEPGQRSELSRLTGIPVSRLEEILALCDLSRITGIGGLYARIVYHSGIRSLREFAGTDPGTHVRKYMEVVEAYGYPATPLDTSAARKPPRAPPKEKKPPAGPKKKTKKKKGAKRKAAAEEVEVVEVAPVLEVDELED